MLVKLAFVMQRLKKYLKKIFVMINKDGGDNFWILWGDTAVMRGDIELMGGSPQSPTRENPDIWCQSTGVLLPVVVCSYVFFHI